MPEKRRKSKNGKELYRYIKSHSEYIIEMFIRKKDVKSLGQVLEPVSYTHLDVYKRQELCMRKVKSIIICDENSGYKTVDGIVYSKDGSKLLFCPAGITGHVRILDGTKIIFRNSFTSSQIAEITIPDSVEMIDDVAFASSLSLIHI